MMAELKCSIGDSNDATNVDVGDAGEKKVVLLMVMMLLMLMLVMLVRKR